MELTFGLSRVISPHQRFPAPESQEAEFPPTSTFLPQRAKRPNFLMCSQVSAVLPHPTCLLRRLGRRLAEATALHPNMTKVVAPDDDYNFVFKGKGWQHGGFGQGLHFRAQLAMVWVGKKLLGSRAVGGRVRERLTWSFGGICPAHPGLALPSTGCLLEAPKNLSPDRIHLMPLQDFSLPIPAR